MHWGLLVPVVAILAWVANNWIRARHGYPLDERRDLRRGRHGTDLEAVNDGYISVTPLQVDLTHHASIGTLAEAYAA